MATVNLTPETLSLAKTRFDSTFEVMRGDRESNEAFMTVASSGTAWLAGTVVDLDANGKLVVAASGKGLGFALQRVKDMSGDNGYRNLAQETANLGDPVGVQFGIGECATKIHTGSANPGAYAYWNGTSLALVATPPSGVKVLGRVLRQDGLDITAAVSGTAGTYSSASSVKAVILFNIPIY